jgi:hypothetical protein
MSGKETNARSYIVAHGGDAFTVAVNIANVEVAISKAKASASSVNVEAVATAAQEAHDNIDAIRADFSTTDYSGALGTAELNVFSGANDLKNSMANLGTELGTPNPANLASFNVHFQEAAAEWNSGVQTIWRIAHRTGAPTV